MPSKTFHFEPDWKKVSEEVVSLYLWSTALTAALCTSLAEEGHDVTWVRLQIRALDKKLVRALRPEGRVEVSDDSLTAPTFFIDPDRNAWKPPTG